MFLLPRKVRSLADGIVQGIGQFRGHGKHDLARLGCRRKRRDDVEPSGTALLDLQLNLAGWAGQFEYALIAEGFVHIRHTTEIISRLQAAHKSPGGHARSRARYGGTGVSPGPPGTPASPCFIAAPPDRLPSARSTIPFWRHWRFRYSPPLYSCLPCPSDRALRRMPSYLYRTESSLPE